MGIGRSAIPVLPPRGACASLSEINGSSMGQSIARSGSSTHGPFGIGAIERRTFVQEIGIFAYNTESMSKAGRDPQLPRCVPVELETDPLSEARAIRSKIDRYIENTSGKNSDELALSIRLLEMQSAQGAECGAGKIILDERFRYTGFTISRIDPRLEKMSAFVRKQAGFDQ